MPPHGRSAMLRLPETRMHLIGPIQGGPPQTPIFIVAALRMGYIKNFCEEFSRFTLSSAIESRQIFGQLPLLRNADAIRQATAARAVLQPGSTQHECHRAPNSRSFD